MDGCRTRSALRLVGICQSRDTRARWTDPERSSPPLARGGKQPGQRNVLNPGPDAVYAVAVPSGSALNVTVTAGNTPRDGQPPAPGGTRSWLAWPDVL
jgi:hypothetical protein